ncbi:unnamed protein product [Lactuca saligna]|uniref:Uncharacterized protein n=1 Tax=Lactuca saligna TaxID=75948 RepID=A0AA36E8M5_LACSI|nr:unnamed protein product [Lactuca saligna]
MKKYEPIFEHLNRMIKCYILELAKMDVEIASILKRKLILKPFDQPQNIENIRGGLIDKEYWSIVYKKEGEEIKNCMFFLRDKHLYPTSALNSILSRAKANKTNCVVDLKCVFDMIRWYLSVMASILKILCQRFLEIRSNKDYFIPI